MSGDTISGATNIQQFISKKAALWQHLGVVLINLLKRIITQPRDYLQNCIDGKWWPFTSQAVPSRLY
jgi:hypothetical protein